MPRAGRRWYSPIPVGPLLEEFSRSEDVRRLFMAYSAKLVAQVHQSVVCAALHSPEARLCRWLLAMQDRTGSDTLHFTHEFLAEILAANRTTVPLAATSWPHSLSTRENHDC